MKQAGHMLKRAISVQSNSDNGRIQLGQGAKKKGHVHYVRTYGTMYGSVRSILFLGHQIHTFPIYRGCRFFYIFQASFSLFSPCKKTYQIKLVFLGIMPLINKGLVCLELLNFSLKLYKNFLEIFKILSQFVCTLAPESKHRQF